MHVNPTQRPVLEVIRDRWSPYRFEPRIVEDEKLVTCLEAARWAASSFNDQPWFWIIARRQHSDRFDRMVGCLLEANQGWARDAGALLLTVIRPVFAYNQKPNRVALHDLGQAAAQLSLQATALGLQTHQMAGINLSLVRQQYAIPEGFEPQTAIAIGYPETGEPVDDAAKELQKRESAPRTRKPLQEHVFSEKWGAQADFAP